MLSYLTPAVVRRFTIISLSLGIGAGAVNAEWDISFVDETNSRLVINSDSPLVPGNPDPLAEGSQVEQDMWCDYFGPDNTFFGCVLVAKQLGTNGGKIRNWLLMRENGQLVDRTTEFASTSDIEDQCSNCGDLGFFTPTADRDVAIADLNGDGWKEVITAVTLSGISGGPGNKWISHPRIYMNQGDDGNGNWLGLIYDDVDRVPTMPAEPRFCSVSPGDVDNDGDVDLYLGDYQQGGSRNQDLNDRLWINDGNGYFTDESSIRMTAVMLESSFAMATVIADVNGDGRNDILKDDALNAPQAVSVSYNNLDGTGTTGFFDNYQLATPSIDPYHINTGDANGDGLLDIAVTRDARDSVLINTGNNAQGQATWFDKIILDSEAGDFGGNNKFMDLDKDGYDDLFITSMDVDLINPGDRGYLFHTIGCGTAGCIPGFENEGNIGIATAHYQGSNDVWNFDINGDTWDDLFICSTSGGCALYVNQPPLAVVFDFPTGQPDIIGLDGTTPIEVDLVEIGSAVVESLDMFVSVDDGPFQTVGMSNTGGLSFEGNFPTSDCLAGVDYYFEANLQGGGFFRNPGEGSYSTFAALGIEITVEDNIEGSVSSWTVVNDGALFAGAWEQAVPVETLSGGNIASPGEDANPEPGLTQAFITQNCPDAPSSCSSGAADVDGGPTDLISPIINLANSDATINYSAWFYTSSPGEESMTVWVTNDGSDWELVETISSTGSEWDEFSFAVSDYVAPTGTVQVRWRAIDQGNPSVVEAGLDRFFVDQILCEACGPELCCDANADGIRDDNCVWCECAGACGLESNTIDIVFGDMGGQFGACMPDGTADGNDRNLALNCFANTFTAEVCENDAPNALNVDAGGPFGDCDPDGVCDGNDAFAALAAFEGTTACSCPLDGGPAPVFENDPAVAGKTGISLVANRTRVLPNGSVEVDVFFDRPLSDVRGYQLHFDVSGGTAGTLELVDMTINTDAKGFALAGSNVWKVTNVNTRQLLVGMDAQGVPTSKTGYLATLTFKASRDAAGTFVVDVLHDDSNAQHRTFLFGSHDSKIELDSVNSAAIEVNRAKSLTATCR